MANDVMELLKKIALSSKENIGKIIITRQNMVIGSSLNKTNYKLGDLCMKGIVGENKFNNINNYNELNNVKFNLITKLSIKISNKIIDLINV